MDSYHRPDPVLYDISPDTGSIDGYIKTVVPMVSVPPR